MQPSKCVLSIAEGNRMNAFSLDHRAGTRNQATTGRGGSGERAFVLCLLGGLGTRLWWAERTPDPLASGRFAVWGLGVSTYVCPAPGRPAGGWARSTPIQGI
jgi:hypothetical protein